MLAGGIEEVSMTTDALEGVLRSYWRAVADQNATALRTYFLPGACIRWHNTDEEFSVDEFVRANCEYPGNWVGEVERIEFCGRGVAVTATHVRAKDDESSFHVVSFISLDENGKILRIDEYWGDDGSTPQWRLDKHIGRAIG